MGTRCWLPWTLCWLPGRKRLSIDDMHTRRLWAKKMLARAEKGGPALKRSVRQRFHSAAASPHVGDNRIVRRRA